MKIELGYFIDVGFTVSDVPLNLSVTSKYDRLEQTQLDATIHTTILQHNSHTRIAHQKPFNEIKKKHNVCL